MPFPVGPALIAGGSLLGGILRNRGQRAVAQDQMGFQERMSSTAYQRAVDDMKLAGINPMLAYQQGGASSPGGAQPSLENVAAPAASSAVHARRLAEEVKNMTQQRKFVKQDTTLKWQQTETEKVRGLVERQRGHLLEADTNLRRASLPTALLESRVSQSRGGRFAAYAKRALSPIFGGGGVGVIMGRGMYRGRRTISPVRRIGR